LVLGPKNVFKPTQLMTSNKDSTSKRYDKKETKLKLTKNNKDVGNEFNFTLNLIPTSNQQLRMEAKKKKKKTDTVHMT